MTVKTLIKALAILVLAIAVTIVGLLAFGYMQMPKNAASTPGGVLFGPGAADPAPSPTPVPTPVLSPTPYFYTPAPIADTRPARFEFIRELETDGEISQSYTSPGDIFFGPADAFSFVEGVTTFRGNNYRDSAAYGTADITLKTLTHVWSAATGSMKRGISSSDPDARWSGSGWVGQPLIVRWPEATKRIMNLYDSAKNKPGLVEVILATMDGSVYFLDLETGEPTRDKLRIGMPFKGAGSIDPRGYPLLYLGPGDGYADKSIDARAMVYSLIDFERLYEFGLREDPFALRKWHAYDSSPLINAASDTLFYPGENGILYRVKLNTHYDEAAGSITVNPSQLVKYRYNAARVDTNGDYWLGFEASAAGWREYLYLADNAGFMQCINVNTMDIVWVQDLLDDTNATPVLEEDEDAHTAYLYVGASLDYLAGDGKGDASFFKLDAVTGEILWQDTRAVRYNASAAGGVQATAALGKHSIDDLVIVSYSRTPNSGSGLIVALDKATGMERWTYPLERYSWPSPVDVYDKFGNAYIVTCDSGGSITLLDGRTGALLDTIQFENNNMEASPAVFDNMLVIGTRSNQILGIRLN
ncbi:MAG: PQQ-binding-like beta-propeller repeat protein [Clostridiales bacterium]|jgi:outer membrane protein assembly factor BamB|nr:PQQ-binding-like beta-propeller repeat protein [Clostridiales bacterium]